jgi:hypothetical protein
MTHTIPTPVFRPHILTNLESRHTLLQRCAIRAMKFNRPDAAMKWQDEALEVEIQISDVRGAMKGAAA